jgi:hypothetical protein
MAINPDISVRGSDNVVITKSKNLSGIVKVVKL